MVSAVESFPGRSIRGMESPTESLLFVPYSTSLSRVPENTRSTRKFVRVHSPAASDTGPSAPPFHPSHSSSSPHLSTPVPQQSPYTPPQFYSPPRTGGAQLAYHDDTPNPWSYDTEDEEVPVCSPVHSPLRGRRSPPLHTSSPSSSSSSHFGDEASTRRSANSGDLLYAKSYPEESQGKLLADATSFGRTTSAPKETTVSLRAIGPSHHTSQASQKSHLPEAGLSHHNLKVKDIEKRRRAKQVLDPWSLVEAVDGPTKRAAEKTKKAAGGASGSATDEAAPGFPSSASGKASTGSSGKAVARSQEQKIPSPVRSLPKSQSKASRVKVGGAIMEVRSESPLRPRPGSIQRSATFNRRSVYEEEQSKLSSGEMDAAASKKLQKSSPPGPRASSLVRSSTFNRPSVVAEEQNELSRGKVEATTSRLQSESPPRPKPGSFARSSTFNRPSAHADEKSKVASLESRSELVKPNGPVRMKGALKSPSDLKSGLRNKGLKSLEPRIKKVQFADKVQVRKLKPAGSS